MPIYVKYIYEVFFDGWAIKENLGGRYIEILYCRKAIGWTKELVEEVVDCLLRIK